MKARFSRKAQNYNSSSKVQKEAANLLLSLIQKNVTSPSYAADLGTGTGYLPQILIQTYPNIKVDCCDISKEMLEIVNLKQAIKQNISTHLCSDPPSKNYDLITSNFSLQWFKSIPTTLSICEQKLREGGLLALSIPIKGTFNHLQEAIFKADVKINTPILPEENEVTSCLTTKNIVESKVFELYETFPNTLDFLKGLHKIGATNEGPVSPARELRKLIACHDQIFNGPIKARYKILQVILKKS